MKTNKKSLLTQRQIIEKKIKHWQVFRTEVTPPSGWIKSIRGALGLSIRQLAERVGISYSAITQLEQRESKGKVTLELLGKVADAMDCQVVYAIVPKTPYKNLEAILDGKAHKVAKELMQEAEHTMRLEAQGTDSEDSKKQIEQLAFELKTKMDPRLWSKKQWK